MLQVNETKTISVCKRTRRSKWGNGQPRNTDKGMRMVVEIYKDSNGNKKSITKFI